MLSFSCDYAEGALEEILQRLRETNLESTPGYGADPYCESAKEKILAKKVSFSIWEKKDEDHTVVRFVTSWATPAEAVGELESIL